MFFNHENMFLIPRKYVFQPRKYVFYPLGSPVVTGFHALRNKEKHKKQVGLVQKLINHEDKDFLRNNKVV